ncbi:hypothetical protein QQ045_023199 [Rhodiola kirilowii]
MAQSYAKRDETQVSAAAATEMKASNNSSFKMNVQAPEFVPPSHSQLPIIPGYIHSYFQYIGECSGSGSGANWFYVADQDQLQLISGSVLECRES